MSLSCLISDARTPASRWQHLKVTVMREDGKKPLDREAKEEAAGRRIRYKSSITTTAYLKAVPEM